MRKLITYLSFNRQTKSLILEAYFHLGKARLDKSASFSKVAPTLGVKMDETDYKTNELHRKTLRVISQVIDIVSRYTFWESQCLVKAIAAMRMLEKRGIESTLYLGTAKDECGLLIAHAWLRSGSYYVTGAEGMERFTVVSKFAKRV